LHLRLHDDDDNDRTKTGCWIVAAVDYDRLKAQSSSD
jgi:hypothetical protein